MLSAHNFRRLFKYLRNIGGPTWWDSGGYPTYCKKMSGKFSEDMLQIVDMNKFGPTHSKSFWFAELDFVEYSDNQLKFVFISDSKEWKFEFVYVGVLKMRGELCLKANLVMVVQELTVLRNGYVRHAFSEFGGNGFVVYAKDVRYIEKMNYQ